MTYPGLSGPKTHEYIRIETEKKYTPGKGGAKVENKIEMRNFHIRCFGGENDGPADVSGEKTTRKPHFRRSYQWKRHGSGIYGIEKPQSIV